MKTFNLRTTVMQTVLRAGQYSAKFSLGAALAAVMIVPAYAVQPADSSSFGNTGSSPMASGIGRTLDDFFIAALEYSPQLQIAEQRWKIGEARIRGANGQWLPQISANATINENRQQQFGQPANEYQGERYSLQLRQMLFNWSAFSRREQAYLEENQFEAEYFGELGQVLTEVAEKYLNVLEAEDALRSMDAEVEAIRSQLAQVERLYGMQMVQITDLYEAQARLAVTEAEQLNLFSEVTLTREILRSATGLAVGELHVLSEDARLPAADGSVDDWVRRARNGNHYITAREYALQVAGKRVSERRGAYYPTVSVVVQQQRTTLGFDNVPIRRTDTGYVGLDVSVPLFAGGSNRAAVSEAASQENIARSELRQVGLDVSERVRMAYLRMNSNYMRIQAAERTLQSADVAATAKQRAFELGTTTSVDLLDAVRMRFMAERDLQRVRYEQLKLGLYLRRDAGVLTAEDLEHISSLLRAAQ